MTFTHAIAAQHSRILILDFGSQYSQLIARRIRELGVYSELYSWDADPELFLEFKPTGIILSGGHESVTEHDTARIPDEIFQLGCPVLGICYGMQAMAAQLGGEVVVGAHREFGEACVHIQRENPLFKGITEGASTVVWMSHGDAVVKLPEGFVTIGQTENTPIAAMADVHRHYYGVQFHPEVTHTVQGERILARFVFDICHCVANWRPSQIVEESIRWIQQCVGKDHVLLALSGGVDSAVTAALLHRAIGDQLHCVFVDHGLLRINEAEEIMTIFGQQQGMRVECVDASKRFLLALRGVADPEEKRRIIGHEFIAVFDEYAEKLSSMQWLAQGTIYPDVIESAKTATGKGQVIKSHHNVGGLPDNMKLKLIEPLRELFKDEVRKIGIELGLPHDRVYRHPFPGPGLAVRILGEIKPEYIHILQKADDIFLSELRAHHLYDQVSQAFVVFLPVKAVAVKGDARHYEYVVALRAVKTTDFMTASWAPLPTDFLAWVATRIMNEIPGIARVTYDISNKPPATIEWE